MRWNYYKLRQLSLVQIAMDGYYKLRQLLYYKVRNGLLQITTGITKCDGFITNRDRYYKVRWLLQIATVHTSQDQDYYLAPKHRVQVRSALKTINLTWGNLNYYHYPLNSCMSFLLIWSAMLRQMQCFLPRDLVNASAVSHGTRSCSKLFGCGPFFQSTFIP